MPVQDRIRKRFNIAPTQDAPVVRASPGGGREVALLRWGLVPFWAKDLKAGTKMINARCEGIEAKPAFREAVRQRRCIVPASGFFEWKPVAGRKQPFAITLPGQRLFAFAGLWERWKPREGGEPVETFAIVTTDASPRVAEIHDRMPVILPDEAIDTWLHGAPDEARALLKPYEGEVQLRPVGAAVGNPRNDGPECLDDAEASRDEPRQGSLL